MRFRTKEKLEFHEYANVYPMMEPRAFNNLVESMQKDGFDKRFPIVLYKGKILDGRNRYKASFEAKMEPIFEEFQGTDEEALEESWKLNSNRRHLTPTQKAVIAAKEVLESRESSGKKISVAKAAKVHAVSIGYIKDAMKVLKEDDKIAEQLFSGKLNMKQAMYNIEYIKSLREGHETSDSYSQDVDEEDDTDEQELTQEQSIIKEFSENPEAIAKRTIQFQNQYKELVMQLKECKAKNKELQTAS